MFCLNCDNEFDEPAAVREYQGECHGFPAYETWAVCPHCKSTDIVEEREDF